MFYVNIFFIYSFLGFLFENIVRFVTNSNFNSGILYGPWTFIYAIAIFVLMFLDKQIKKLKFDKWAEIVLFYGIATIVMGLIEFSGGMIIEKVMHRVYWDYTNLKFNLGHYVALEILVCWGFFATIVNYLVVPIINKFARKIPSFVSVILIILFCLDIVATIVN